MPLCGQCRRNFKIAELKKYHSYCESCGRSIAARKRKAEGKKVRKMVRHTFFTIQFCRENFGPCAQYTSTLNRDYLVSKGFYPDVE